MYVANGVVYGSSASLSSLEVSSVKALDDQMMIITFSTGEERLFDGTLLNGDVYKPLVNMENFKNVTVDHGIVTWMDGRIDCGTEFLYENSYEYPSIRN